MIPKSRTQLRSAASSLSVDRGGGGEGALILQPAPHTCAGPIRQRGQRERFGEPVVAPAPSVSYEDWGMAASLITMSDWPSVGISHMVIVVCVGYEEKEEGHFSLASPFLSLHENSLGLGPDWLERKEMFHDLARGRIGF